MYYLVLQNTNRRGSSWPLGDAHLVIGRNEDCAIRVVDPAISRRHCEVWAADGMPLFQDLGASNPALVNGEPLRAGALKMGDTLAVGPAVFVISTVASEPPQRGDALDESPITLAVHGGIYTQDASAANALKATPRTIHELYDLFHLARELGAVQTAPELTALLEGALRERFAPNALWIAWRHGTHSELFWQATDGPPLPDSTASALLRQALVERQGVISRGTHRKGHGAEQETRMAVPLLHAGDALGGFVLLGRAPGRIYAEDDLQFALGVAAIVAPHVRAVQHAEQLRRDHESLRQNTGISNELIGESRIMKELRAQLVKAAMGHMNVLLKGETGTGKELAARFLHDNSPRAKGPYVIINCAAIPGELFESEMFGSVKGGFMGATDRAGRMEEAHGGTLFLDEIADLAPNHQARILRAIENGEYSRIGSNKVARADVRFVAATNKRLDAPHFRGDLFQRLNGFSIDLPPLRSRLDDIPALARYFLNAAARRMPNPASDIAPDSIARLQKHPWVGNVRELKAVIEASLLGATQSVLNLEDLEPHLTSRAPGGHAPNGGPDEGPLVTLAEYDRAYIQKVHRHCKGNIAAAARILGITRVTLYKHLNDNMPRIDTE